MRANLLSSQLEERRANATKVPKIVAVTLNETIEINVQANQATKVSLFLDDTLLKEVNGNSLQYSLIADDYETHLVKAIAEDATSFVADSFTYTTRPEIEIAERFIIASSRKRIRVCDRGL